MFNTLEYSQENTHPNREMHTNPCKKTKEQKYTPKEHSNFYYIPKLRLEDRPRAECGAVRDGISEDEASNPSVSSNS